MYVCMYVCIYYDICAAFASAAPSRSEPGMPHLSLSLSLSLVNLVKWEHTQALPKLSKHNRAQYASSLSLSLSLSLL